MTRLILLCFIAVALCQVDVEFQLVRYNAETLTRDQLMSAFESLGLQNPSAYNLHTIDLDAVILQDQCQAGWYWSTGQCLPCQCLVRMQSAELSVWFDLLE